MMRRGFAFGMTGRVRSEDRISGLQFVAERAVRVGLFTFASQEIRLLGVNMRSSRIVGWRWRVGIVNGY